MGYPSYTNIFAYSVTAQCLPWHSEVTDQDVQGWGCPPKMADSQWWDQISPHHIIRTIVTTVYSGCMIANHANQVILDNLVKQNGAFDVATAYEAMKEQASALHSLCMHPSTK